MRVFLDIGAHTGQSLREARKWGFDRIVSFEPASQCWPILEQEAQGDARITIERFGLSDRTEHRTLYMPSGKGASLWWRAMKRGGDTPTEWCMFMRASDWFARNLSPSDEVVAKLNCEGSEAAIVNDLLDSGEFSKVTRALIRMDARKIPEIAHEADALTHRLAPYSKRGAVCIERYQPLAGWLAAADRGRGRG